MGEMILGYIFMLIGVFGSSLKGYMGKRVSDRITGIEDATWINLVRNLLCVGISLILFLLFSPVADLLPSGTELLLCAVSGISMAIFILTWNFAVRRSAFMLVSAFCTASFIVPFLAGIFLFREALTWTRLAALAIICIAMFFLLRYSSTIKTKIKASDLILLFGMSLAQGVNQVTQKLYTLHFPQKDVAVYTFYTFLFTALSLLLFRFTQRKNPISPERKRAFLPAIVLMALGLFLNSYFQTFAAARLDSMVLYPIVNTLSLVSGALMSALFFKERLTRDSIIGTVLVLIAILLNR